MTLTHKEVLTSLLETARARMDNARGYVDRAPTPANQGAWEYHAGQVNAYETALRTLDDLETGRPLTVVLGQH